MTGWLTADAANICRSALWERITGWEVVAAVLLIVSAWSVVQVSRLYYTWRIAQIGRDDER